MNQANKQLRVMVFGTFDIVHSGHRNFFKQAKALARNSYLIVSIARDKNVERIKGQAPYNPQMYRLRIVRSVPGVDKAVLGGFREHMPHIIREKPDFIALGYDQVAYVRGLKSELKRAGLSTKVVRLKPYKPHLYKSTIIKQKRGL